MALWLAHNGLNLLRQHTRLRLVIPPGQRCRTHEVADEALPYFAVLDDGMRTCGIPNGR
jgi:hypothetical protein